MSRTNYATRGLRKKTVTAVLSSVPSLSKDRTNTYILIWTFGRTCSLGLLITVIASNNVEILCPQISVKLDVIENTGSKS